MKRIGIKIFVLLLVAGAGLFVLAQARNQAVFFCKYCGRKTSSVASLTASLCIRHPDGPAKGRHVLYEGSEKKSYTCKYCGKQASDIMSLTASKCIRHPKGPAKGNHEPAL